MSYINAEIKYNNALSEHNMLKGHKSVLVGFSGGSDSSLLLTLLSKTENIKVAAAHLNHGIRGEEADRDEKFCVEFCKKSGIKIFLRQCNIPEIAKEKGQTIEEAARIERYKFFDEICIHEGYDLIATAHNSDDNIETVIFHLIRGCGLNGLCGIPPVRDNVIRPLIYLSKDEINSACSDGGIEYVTDSTNFDTEYSRNYIRHEISPRLRKLNTSLNNSISNTLNLLKTDLDYINNEVSKYSFNNTRSELSSLHKAILSRVIISEFSKYGITPEAKHINTAISNIQNMNKHLTFEISNLSLVCDRDKVYIIEKGINDAENIRVPLNYGITEFGEQYVYCVYPDGEVDEKYINTLKNIYKFSIHLLASSAKINDSCNFVHRKDGDTYRYGSMTRKVKKLIQSLKLPKKYTDNLPFIEGNNEILYIPHFSLSDSAKPNNESDIAHIYFFSNQE